MKESFQVYLIPCFYVIERIHTPIYAGAKNDRLYQCETGKNELYFFSSLIKY